MMILPISANLHIFKVKSIYPINANLVKNLLKLSPLEKTATD